MALFRKMVSSSVAAGLVGFCYETASSVTEERIRFRRDKTDCMRLEPSVTELTIGRPFHDKSKLQPSATSLDPFRNVEPRAVPRPKLACSFATKPEPSAMHLEPSRGFCVEPSNNNTQLVFALPQQKGSRRQGSEGWLSCFSRVLDVRDRIGLLFRD